MLAFMKIKKIFFYLFFVQASYAYDANDNISKYLEYFSFIGFGNAGNYKNGEMQIVDDYDAMLQIQHQYYNQFIKKGLKHDAAKQYSRVGIVQEDPYWIWLRDPLILPNHTTTAYNRFFPRSGLNGVSGIVVMGVDEDHKILINIIFRHATRAWEVELPRGAREKHETSEQAAFRELEEETGFRAKNLIKIATIASDSGILSNFMDLYVATDLTFFKSNREACEAIGDCISVSKQALKQAFVDGFVEIEIRGNKVKVFCRDSYLASALLIAEAKSIL